MSEPLVLDEIAAAKAATPDAATGVKRASGGTIAGSSRITIDQAPAATQIVHVPVPCCPRCGWTR